MLRAVLTAAGATVAALAVYAVVVVVLGTLDARANLETSTSWTVFSTVLYAVPFAAGALAGIRAGLRALPPPSALAAGAGGTLAVFVAVTLAGRGTDLVSVAVPAAGTAVGVWLALRTSATSARGPEASGSPGRLRRNSPPDGRG